MGRYTQARRASRRSTRKATVSGVVHTPRMHTIGVLDATAKLRALSEHSYGRFASHDVLGLSMTSLTVRGSHRWQLDAPVVIELHLPRRGIRLSLYARVQKSVEADGWHQMRLDFAPFSDAPEENTLSALRILHELELHPLRGAIPGST